jgi:hypothetical protein
MVNSRHGQAMTEFVLVLAVLTSIGILIMAIMTDRGPHARNAIGATQQNAVNAITQDQD